MKFSSISQKLGQIKYSWRFSSNLTEKSHYDKGFLQSNCKISSNHLTIWDFLNGRLPKWVTLVSCFTFFFCKILVNEIFPKIYYIFCSAKIPWNQKLACFYINNFYFFYKDYQNTPRLPHSNLYIKFGNKKWYLKSKYS